MKLVKMFEKGEHILLELEISKVSLVSGEPQYDLRDPITGEFLNNKYTGNRLIPTETEGEEDVEG